MSKITFRADDDLIRQLEAFDASKSEVMRDALRAYLDERMSAGAPTREASEGTLSEGTLDDILVERIDALIAERLDGAFTPHDPQDINVNISLDGDPAVSGGESRETRKTPTPESENASDMDGQPCKQCGETLSPAAVYCANCGNKTSHRLFCDCGDELRSDWGFCPGCGRRTPTADVLGDS